MITLKKVRNSGRVLTNYNPSYLSGIRLPKSRHSIKLSDETNLFFFPWSVIIDSSTG
jgi:hypothetical protein